MIQVDAKGVTGQIKFGQSVPMTGASGGGGGGAGGVTVIPRQSGKNNLVLAVREADNFVAESGLQIHLDSKLDRIVVHSTDGLVELGYIDAGLFYEWAEGERVAWALSLRPKPGKEHDPRVVAAWAKAAVEVASC